LLGEQEKFEEINERNREVGKSLPGKAFHLIVVEDVEKNNFVRINAHDQSPTPIESRFVKEVP
jgi:hypothetical protein